MPFVFGLGNNSRLMNLKSLAQIAENNNIEKYEFLNVNLATFVQSIAHSDDIILITGSILSLEKLKNCDETKKTAICRK